MSECMKFSRYEDRGAGMCAVFELNFPAISYWYNFDGSYKPVWEHEAAFNRMSLETRIDNLKRSGYDFSESLAALDGWPIEVR